MKKLFITSVAVLCAFMMATSAWGLSVDDHVKIAPNGEGDVLIFPFYIARPGGWQTKLTVINTDDIESVVAKLVVWTGGFTFEVLDFLLYLSPNDAWSGVLRYDSAQNDQVMYSIDDSVLLEKGTGGVANTWVSAANPLNRPLDIYDDMCPQELYDLSDFKDIGYVIVVMAGHRTIAKNALGTVAKDTILQLYDGGGFVPYTPINTLAGYLEVSNTQLGVTSMMQATALADYDANARLTHGVYTYLGQPGANNNVFEVEAALSRDALAMPYIVDQNQLVYHLVNFPLKQSDYADCRRDDNGNVVNEDGRGIFNRNQATAVLNTDETDSVPGTWIHSWPYEIDVYDMSENTPGTTDAPFSPLPPEGVGDRFPYEVNWVPITGFTAGYTEGWLRYRFDDEDGTEHWTTWFNRADELLSYSGAPVIGYTLSFGAYGLSLSYVAHEDGVVLWQNHGFATLDDPAVLNYYQYYDTTNYNWPTGIDVDPHWASGEDRRIQPDGDLPGECY